MNLLAGRWGSQDNDAFIQELFEAYSRLGVRWSLDSLGIDRIQFSVKARNKFDKQDRLKNHQGDRMGVLSNLGFRPITGHCIRVEPDAFNRVLYDIRGIGAIRTSDEYEKTIPALATTVSTAMASVITDHIPAASSDQSQVYASNATTMGGASPDLPVGTYPLEWIKLLLNKSDSSGNLYDFWFIDEPINDLSLRGYQAYYQRRGVSLSPLWEIRQADTTGITTTRSIDDLKTDVTIYYGTIPGTVTTGDATGVTLTDSGATLEGDGVTSGDRVVNLTDGSHARVVDVVSDTVLTTSGLSGGTDDQWDINDDYAVEIQNPQASTNSTATATYWTREYAESRPEMNATQAAQYRDALLTNDASPLQIAPFAITAPFITDDANVQWPLWEVIAQGGGYIRIIDLPEIDIANESLNGLSVFKITALDYDHDGKQLRVAVDTKDRRLDARLLREGILTGTIISRR